MARTPYQVGDQRRAVGAVLRQWGTDGDALDSVALVVSELLSNAVLYGECGSIGLSVVHSPVDGWVLVEVNDHTPCPRPEPPPAGPDQEGGRGLFLVKTLSEDWGTGAGGALTWCRVTTAAGGVR
ncbi:ATP-binding protein [Streptomyces sp. NBC_00654]|uniref:ATP-binding protein n=1 Tax=Streptomyces sp. NBC_00654 TaxID=2975799 RepID=UPI0022536C96|nr:ATP-binding protein [Streptomyces sp. NBC_00654]MCX4970468.1 ATP-binding protein [Streptomyces sp. NBC_00654]